MDKGGLGTEASSSKLMPHYSPEMKVDILGRIRNMHVPVQHAFQPVFEAVVNSIHSTERLFRDEVSSKGSIEVRVHRIPQETLEFGSPGRTPVPDVVGFSVIDNGEGFTDPNLKAFETADTTAKADLGGKGVGRFTWLVVFERASVTSIFETSEGQKRQRTFAFRPTLSAIEEFDQRDMTDAPDRETRVVLRGIRPRYSDELRKSAEVIADRLFEHCFNYFVIGRCPRIHLVDDAPDQGKIDVNAKVRDIHISEPLPLFVDKHALQVRHVQQKHRPGRKHIAHLCAHQRVVTQIPLSEISDLGSEPIKGSDGQLVVHHVFVAGSSLDEAVDASRTYLNLPDGEPLLERAGALDLKTLREELGKHVNERLADTLNAAREENFERIQLHVRAEQPEYRHLLKRVPEQLRNVRYTENRKQLDEALYRVKQAWEADVRRRQAEVEARLSASDADPDQFAEELARVIAEVNDAGQADLVRYVAQRRAVLNLLGSLISKLQGGPALEEHVHRVVFPLKKTGDDVGFGDHNLWLVDDTLSFYEHLASDVSFSKNTAAPVASQRRPDILAFKTGDPYQHVAIVEFKRPDRDDENPVQQLVEYAQLLRKGGALDANGVTLPGIDRSVRIDAYAVATLTPKLQEALEVSPGDLHKVENEWRWYGHVSNLNTTIEVLDYRAFVRRAEQRNKAFFNQLGLR